MQSFQKKHISRRTKQVLTRHGINPSRKPSFYERLRREINQLHVPTNHDPIKMSFSAGVAQLGQGESSDAFIQAADKAMYRAKNGGRNQVAMRE